MTDDRALLLNYLQGEATPDEVARVQALLAAEPGRVAELYALAETERDLAEVCRANLGLETPLASQVNTRQRSAVLPSKWKFYRRIAATAAALLLLALASWLFMGSADAPVRLAQVHGEVYLLTDGGEHAVQSGTVLLQGQGLKTVGEASGATLALADGGQVELAGNTALSLAVADRLAVTRYQLSQGRITARVGPLPAGASMVFATPQGEAEVLGTWLALAVDEDGTRLEVEKGSVRLTSQDDQSSVVVTENQFAVLTRTVAEPEDALAPAPRSGAARFSSDGRTVVADTEDGSLVFSDLATGRETRVWRRDGKPGRSLSLSPDGQLLVIGTPDGFRLRDVASGELRGFIRFPGGLNRVPAFTPDSQAMAISIRNRVRVFDVRTGKDAAMLSQEGFVSAHAFAPDNQLLASNRTPNLVLWNWREKQRVATMETNGKPILELAFSPDGQTLAAASQDHVVTLWDLPARRVRHTLAHKRTVRVMAFSPDAATLATATGDDNVVLWDTRGGTRKRVLSVPGGRVMFLAYSRDGRVLAAGCQDRSVQRWDLTVTP